MDFTTTPTVASSSNPTAPADNRGYINPRHMAPRTQKMNWRVIENDCELVLYGFEREVVSSQYEEIANTYHENPTAKAVMERLAKLRKIQRQLLTKMGVLDGDADDGDEDDEDGGYELERKRKVSAPKSKKSRRDGMGGGSSSGVGVGMSMGDELDGAADRLLGRFEAVCDDNGQVSDEAFALLIADAEAKNEQYEKVKGELKDALYRVQEAKNCRESHGGA